ncbi:MAG TPA: indole-3-glycerol phosphate synthase TrpC [Candidatus Scybalocola faecavium]|nr:indole-3-glycerol phosphate synthase TrpC [Candidatus Scybalocola faecavium]
MNILDEIAGRARERVEAAEKVRPKAIVRREAEALCQREETNEDKFGPWGKGGAGLEKRQSFAGALSGTELKFICEVKKASPSKGIIARDFPWLDIAREYEAAGAAAISCLTEPYWFLGKDEYLKEIAKTVHIPVLRKDFTVDDYMIYEAKTLGAAAVLLICTILDDCQLKDYLQLTQSLNMDALVEAHTPEEIKRAVKAGAKIIGVNNRNLKDFSADIKNSHRLRSLAPPETLFVSESGIKTREDIQILKENGTNAVLIGETLMRAGDKKKMLDYLAGRRENDDPD